MRSIVIIPVRGGSRGLPGKNIKPIGGRSLLAHTLDAARRARHVEGVFVSTDSPPIAEVPETFGAEVIWRPAEISGDSASSESALLHALDQLEREGRLSAPLLTFLQCTAPLTPRSGHRRRDREARGRADEHLHRGRCWGTDQSASVESAGFARLVRDIRVVESAFGGGERRIYESEVEMRAKLRRR